MTVIIKTVMAHPKGQFIVNRGLSDEIAISTNPDNSDPNYSILMDWFRTNKADSWVPALDEHKQLAVATVASFATAFTNKFVEGISSVEVASWSTKAAAARAHTTENPNPLILAEADLTGENPTELAALIVAKADVYESIIARVTGLRRSLVSSIDAASSAEAVNATLAAGLADANALAAQLGITL